jgi:hypothetical protein
MEAKIPEENCKHLGLDFPTLCRLTMTDPEGNQLQPEAFMRELLKSKLHINDKETWDYSKTSSERGDDESVDDVWDLLRKAFFSMCGGRNRNVDAYIPLEKICEGFQDALGADFDAAGLAERILQEEGVEASQRSAQAVLYDDPNSSFQKRIQEEQEKQEDEAKYEVATVNDLMDFVQKEDGSYTSVMPSFDQWMLGNAQSMREFANHAWPEFSALDAEGRKKWFQTHYQMLITERLHQKMWEHIMDEDFIRPYIAVFMIDCNRSDTIHIMTHALLWNETLLRYYWDRAKDSPENFSDE